MIWAMANQLSPGRLVDVGSDPSDQIVIECRLDPDHIRSKRDWSVVNYVEPAAPQRRMVAGLDLYFCINSSSFLVSTTLRDAMVEAELTGWADIPAPVQLRSGGILDGYHEIRITGCCDLPGPETGLRMVSRCPDCGYRRYAPGFRYDLAVEALPRTRPDFLTIWPLVGRTLCSDRARKLFERFDTDAVTFVDAASFSKPLRPGDAEPPPFLPEAYRAAVARFRDAPLAD